MYNKLCHSGALLHSKNNAMFIKHFKPWVEVIRARFFTTIFKTSCFEHSVFCNLHLQNVSLQ